jgi:outer membrane receptor protein involved in Fe transport
MAFQISAASTRSFSRTDSEKFSIEIASFRRFNQMESLDILKGPGAAIYGPSGGGLGGYVNFITKSPQFDGYHEQLETTIGDLAGGGQSWHHYEWAIDSTGPLLRIN